MVAVLSFFYIYAGACARGAASAALRTGVPPRLMPLLLGSCALPPA